jgi:cytochrome P450
VGFSAGAHSCIGHRFALTEAVAILANLVRMFEILLPPEVELKVKEMEKNGVGELERFAWMTAWTPNICTLPLRAHVRPKRRA